MAVCLFRGPPNCETCSDEDEAGSVSTPRDWRIEGTVGTGRIDDNGPHGAC